MSKKLISVILAILFLVALAGCDSTKSTPSSTPDSAEPAAAVASVPTQVSPPSPPSEPAPPPEGKLVPDGTIVDGAQATKENPVPFGTWVSVTVSDGGWPKPAYVRVVNVITDQSQSQALIDEYNSKHSGNGVPSLEEHAEFLDYVIAEYEVFFPADFSDSDSISFYALSFSRKNNQEGGWIASNGSSYLSMGSMTILDGPSRETGFPKPGDTVTCKVLYSMIQDYTDYALHYDERTEDLSATIETYFAVA